jgi:hypothetical protein
VPETARYKITGQFTRSYDYGDWQMLVNGSEVGDTVRGYSPTVSHSGSVEIGTAELNAGINRIELRVEGKNDQSSGYWVGIDGFDFQIITP